MGRGAAHSPSAFPLIWLPLSGPEEVELPCLLSPSIPHLGRQSRAQGRGRGGAGAGPHALGLLAERGASFNL